MGVPQQIRETYSNLFEVYNFYSFDILEVNFLLKFFLYIIFNALSVAPQTVYAFLHLDKLIPTQFIILDFDLISTLAFSHLFQKRMHYVLQGSISKSNQLCLFLPLELAEEGKFHKNILLSLKPCLWINWLIVVTFDIIPVPNLN